MDNVYVKKGYKDRKDYLQQMSVEYGVYDELVWSLADMLGPSEDFDGLVSALEDYRRPLR